MTSVGKGSRRTSVVRRTAEGTASAGEDTAAEGVLCFEIRKEVIDDGGTEIVHVGNVVAEFRCVFAVMPKLFVTFKVIFQRNDHFVHRIFLLLKYECFDGIQRVCCIGNALGKNLSVTVERTAPLVVASLFKASLDDAGAQRIRAETGKRLLCRVGHADRRIGDMLHLLIEQRKEIVKGFAVAR